jgi:hypothetical protein
MNDTWPTKTDRMCTPGAVVVMRDEQYVGYTSDHPDVSCSLCPYFMTEATQEPCIICISSEAVWVPADLVAKANLLGVSPWDIKA